MRFCLVVLGFAAVSAPACAQSLDLAGEGVSLAMKLSAAPADGQPASPEVSSQADLAGQISGLETRVQLGMKTGQPAPSAGGGGGGGGLDPGWWNSTHAAVDAAWAVSSAAKVEIGAQSASRVQFTASDPVFSDASQHYAESRQTGANADVTLNPLPKVEVKLGARVSSDVQQDASLSGSGGQSSDLMQTDTRQLSATLGLSPLPAVRVEAGGQMHAMGLTWSGGRAATYASLDPSAHVSATPWSGGSFKLSLDRSTTPLSTDQFVGYGAGAVALAGVEPSREWRYGAALTQKAGPVDLTASLTEARVQSFAYLGPAGALGQGSVGRGEGGRSELSGGMAAPLPVWGLEPFKLEAQATWRASSVQDPLTGALGRMSGERPYDARLSLSQAVGPRMLWGVTAEAAGPQTNLGPTQVATLSSTAGLGGFLQYKARPVTVRLSLDNVLGGERSERDVFYAGGRDLNQIDHASEARTVDRGIHLSLIRPL